MLKVVDVAFTPEWAKVITQIGQAQPPSDPQEEAGVHNTCKVFDVGMPKSRTDGHGLPHEIP